MFIVIPVAHEQQKVQRLPWVTFALIAINVIAYLITGPGRDDNQAAVSQKYDQILRYYVQHPYLDFPENTKPFLSQSEIEKIEAMRESADKPLDQDTLDEEQSELDEFAGEFNNLLNQDPIRKYGFVPNDPHLTNLFTCMFMHAGFLHLFGNMLFLFLAGCAIEDAWGRPLYLVFYLVSGLLATGAHQVIYPHSAAPLVGASGAIAGLMGAFLVRLAKTRIRFFYLLWLIVPIRTGSFYAPAYIVLPLWLAEQFLAASLDNGSGGVAVWAHIGGFIFGAIVAVVIKLTNFEEKFITPSIEKKVSLEQNPLFLKGMQLSENKDYPGALICLQKVVRQDPNHYEAYMEMRTIAEVTGDRAGYNRNTAGIFDIVLRNREFDLFVDLLTPYKQHPLRDALPPRTLMGIGKFFEEQNDSVTATGYYEELVQRHHDDPLAIKAYSRLAHLYHDKMENKNRAVEAFREAYFHPQSSEEWKKGLLSEMKKFGITLDHLGGAKLTEPEPAPKAPVPSTVEDFNSFEFESSSSAVAAPVKMPPKEPMLLPSSVFDGMNGNRTIVKCKIEKIGLKGLILKTDDKTGQLPWKRIRAISVASLQNLRSNGNPLIIDWIAQPLVEENKKVIYRTFGSEIDFARIFPRVEQSFDEAYRNFIGIVLRNSGAKCLPDSNRCVGPVFLVLPGMNEYESYLEKSI